VAEATTAKQPAAQVPFARKAAKLKAKRQPAVSAKRIAANKAHLIEAGLAADNAQHQSDRKYAHGAQAPPVRLLTKAEILQITGVTFPTIWAWMRGKGGTFPRSRIVGGKSMWLSTEVEAWLAGLPLRPLKGDASPEQAE